jgi:hypothetical protein
MATHTNAPQSGFASRAAVSIRSAAFAIPHTSVQPLINQDASPKRIIDTKSDNTGRRKDLLALQVICDK